MDEAQWYSPSMYKAQDSVSDMKKKFLWVKRLKVKA